ncbi:MAG: hypothetical protein ACHREM_24210 [Polyangiales bacterium]
MVRTRLAAALLILGVTVLGLACEFATPNGQYCTKDRDCVSDHCVQQVCTEIGSSQQIGTGTTSETGTSETASSETGDAATETSSNDASGD